MIATNTSPAGTDKPKTGQIRDVELKVRVTNRRIAAFLDGVDSLPSPPRIITQLNEAIGLGTTGVREVTDIVSQDIAVTARVLQVVNSAFFSLTRNLTDIREAVTYLGFEAVRNLAIALEMFRTLTNSNSPLAVQQIELLGEHSSFVAQLTRQFISDKQDAQDAFVGGLLHDVGHLVLCSHFPTFYSEIQQRVADGQFILDAERDIIGINHADLGAQLIHQWGLPTRIVDVVAFHHEAPRFTNLGMDALHGVYIAEHLMAEASNPEYTYWEFGGIDSMDDRYLTKLDMYDRINRWRQLNIHTRIYD